MYLNARRHMAALGVQSMFLLTSYGDASTEWVNVQIEWMKIAWWICSHPEQYITEVSSLLY